MKNTNSKLSSGSSRVRSTGERTQFNFGEETQKDPGPQNRHQRRAYATQRKLFFRSVSKQAAKMANSADAQEAERLLKEKFGEQATLISHEDDNG